MATAIDLPNLGLVAFHVDDNGDHPGGAHCISLNRTESKGTVELVEQYLSALKYLAARAADSPDGGWELTRPLLFHARTTPPSWPRSRRFSPAAWTSSPVTVW